ncbi:MAG: LysR family transcriptional regulator [Betaproteobacteria bacterium]|nr:LysR family transcriptional regulator [Betaproteobacteria bacterium]
MPVASSVNLNRLAAFAAVVESGSFTAAAEKLGLTKAMVSQHVSRLEKELGIGLLTRTTRKVTPTETGAVFYADCAQVLQELEAAIARVGGGSEVPSGTLRLTTAEDYGSAVVVPALAAFMHRFPEVKVEFVATDQVVDLVAGRFDLAIRTGWLRDSSLRAARLGGFDQVVAAAPAYLKKFGTPKRPEDLAKHLWIALTLLCGALTWTFSAKDGKTQTVRVSSTVSTNSTASLRAFMREGVGVSILPQYMLDADIRAGRLVRLLAGWSLPQGGVHAVYPNARYTSAKVRAFLDFFRAYLARR